MFNLDKAENKKTLPEIIQQSLEILTKKLNEISSLSVDPSIALSWITSVFEDAARLVEDKSLEIDAPTPLELPREISAYTIQTVIRLLTLKSDPEDNALYYLSDTGSALGIQSEEMRNLLDREFDKLRYEFTIQLKKELDSDQLYWCALILVKIICADGQIHPAEKSFFDIISELIKESDYTLDTIKKAALEQSSLPKLNLNPGPAESMLKYVVTIAMCDGEYVGQESEFIKQAAESLGIEPSEIDTVLQPVASSFMVLESLFPRKT